MPFSSLPMDFRYADSINCKFLPGQSECFDHTAETYRFQRDCLHLGRDSRNTSLHLAPTSFGAGTATAGLRKGSDFLFSIDSGKAWDDIQELFKTPAVLSKHGQDYEYWVAEADDTTNDLNRAKDILQEALADQAPQPEEQKVELNGE
mmetsp:Transcript_3913/g.4472  ORF Transcript_3913/g.4472 Transcript_3913/m.4472 type:complete len:148 (+) Transcript_3913:73-516(+)